MLGHQDAGNLWEVSNGPIPPADGLALQTREVFPESNGQKGSRFSIRPTFLKKPDSDVERAGFNIRAGAGSTGTGGSIAIRDAADFEAFRTLMAGAAAAGVGEIPLRVIYTGAMLDLTKTAAKKLGAVFTLDLEESDEMIYGRFVITGNAGEELYSARATSGQRRFQHPGEFWTRGKGVVPPTDDARFIEMKVFKSDPPMGTRYRILPEEVSNPAGTVTRSAFRVHFDGGSPGSAGCIVFPSTSDYRQLIGVFAALKENGVEKIPLTLNYA